MALAKTRTLNKIEIVGSFKHLQARYEIKATYAGRQYVSALDGTTTLTFRNGELLGIAFDVDEDSEIAVSIIYKTSKAIPSNSPFLNVRVVVLIYRSLF